MAARLLLLGRVVVGAVVAVHALRTDHRCAEVKTAAAHGPLNQPAVVAREAAERCGDPRDRAVVALVLVAHRQRGAALDLARRMTRSSPAIPGMARRLAADGGSRRPGAGARARPPRRASAP